MEEIICNLCAGSPEIDLYKINLSDKEKQRLNKSYSPLQVDICIGKEIENLIRKGIRTYGCCCGHGEREPSCLVSIDDMNELSIMDYTLHEYNKEWTKNGIMEIYLKTNIQCELRKVLSQKVFRYLGGN